MSGEKLKPLTLALLGATGQTGRETLHALLDRDFDILNIYVRSLEKLLSLFPDIQSDPRVRIYVGSIQDQDLIQQCLSDTQVIINTLGSDGMEPDTILRDSARIIIAALEALRSVQHSWQKPRLLWLSSATFNERSAAAQPKIIHWLIETAFQYGYDDLRVAHKIILNDDTLVSVLLIQPNVLIHESPSGHEITTEAARLGVSYQDLGNAFVELALDQRYEQFHEISVSSRNGDDFVKYAPMIIFKLSQGFFVNFFPFGVRINRFIQGLFT